MVKIVLFIGPTGSGKSLQAKRLAQKLEYKYVSTGELLRASLEPKITQVLAEGKLADPEDVKRILKTELDTVADGGGVVLDGCVRIKEEAEWLETYLQGRGGAEMKVFFLLVSKQEAMLRLRLRHRSDDSEALYDKKMEEYHKITMPVVDFYRDKGIIAEINGDQSIELVARAVEAAL